MPGGCGIDQIPLKQPRLRIRGSGSFPDLEVKLGLIGDGVHYPNLLPAAHLIPRLDIHLLKLTIETVVFAVLDEYTLVISRHHHHLAHLSIENRLNGLQRGGRDIHPIVKRQLHILIHRVLVLAITPYYSAVYWPRQLALISRELL